MGFFSVALVLFLLAVAVAGVALGAIVGAVDGDARDGLFRGLEAAGLAIAGGLLARTFVFLLLHLAADVPFAGKSVGWGFFLWPGLIDTIPGFFGKQYLTVPAALLWTATGVGALAGMLDGFWRIHDWKGLGWLSFPLDVTWGLAGTTNGCLVHLCNIGWGRHANDVRTGNHRYESGFCFKSGYAFTQGAVMSSLSDPPGSDLFRHERTHVWQNRIFGPFFVLSYLGWMVLLFVPGIIAGVVSGAGPFQGVEKWCYFNNAWEVWGYAVQHQEREGLCDNTEQRALIWPPAYVILGSIPYFGGTLALAGLILARGW